MWNNDLEMYFIQWSGHSGICRKNLNAKGYQNILENHLWPVEAKYFPSNNFIFQDDNASVHRARSV